MTINVESNNLQLPSIEDLVTMSATEEMKKSAITESKQQNLLIQHVLLTMYSQTNTILKESDSLMESSESSISPSLRSASKSSALSSNESKGYASRGSFGAYGMPTSETASKWPSQTTGNFKNDYDTLINMLSWQCGHFADMSRAQNILNYLIDFSNRYSDKIAADGTLKNLIQNIIETYMEALIAKTYLSGGDISQIINDLIKQLSSGSDFLKFISNDFSSKNKFNPSYYEKEYTDPTDHSKKMNNDYKIQSLLAICANDSMHKLISKLYQAELQDIIAKAADATLKGHNNIQLIFLLLLSVIENKERNTEDEIVGCANMLKELGYGETATGNAQDALSEIINQLMNPNMTAINTELNVIVKYMRDYPNWNNIDVAHRLFSLGITNSDAVYSFLHLHDVICSQDNPIPYPADWQKLTTFQKTNILSSLETINRYEPSLWTKLDNFTTPEAVKTLINNISGDKEKAKELAQALVQLEEMGSYFDSSILQGLKDITSKLLGDETGTGGDFFSITGLTLKDLKIAASGDSKEAQEAQTKILEALKKLLPSVQQEIDTNPLTTITNELNQIATYFNDQNNAEQANAQFISSNDEKMLSFIKEMYDSIISLEKGLMQNLQRSGS